MKIFVIFTGGTIGSTLSGDWIAADSSTNYLLLDKYRAKTGDNETQFDISTPCTMLSENLTSTQLNLIIDSVLKNLDKDYDGIIVTHGTDTLQYTASAISYAVSGTKMPVMLVSSDYPLGDERANGLANFIAAVEFIRAKAGEGVFVPYRNLRCETTSIFTATDIYSHSEASGDLYAAGGAFAHYDSSIKLNPEYNKRPLKKGVGNVKYVDEPKILTITSLPADSFSYSLDGIKAVIIRPYHSGTLNTASGKLREFCKRAREKGIPVFLVNAVSGKNYESAKLFDDLGIIKLSDSAYPAVYVKCWLGISMNKNLKELF